MIYAIEVNNFINSNSNELGSTMRMTLAKPETSLGFAVTSVDGLGLGSGDITISEWVTIPGGAFESAHIPKRTISIDLRFIPKDPDPITMSKGDTVADVRRRTYWFFPLNKKIRLTFYQRNLEGEISSYYIDGYVSRNEPDIWSPEEGSKIQVVCPDPFFKSTKDIVGNFNQVLSLFAFPFPVDDEWHQERNISVPFPISEKLKPDKQDIHNESNIETGAIFTIDATGDIVNPMIYSETTRQTLKLKYTIKDGERVIIDTRPGVKTITRDDGFNTNMIKYLDLDSDFITFKPGSNIIGIHCDNSSGMDNFRMSYRLTPLYGGI
jgi:hypothetical protein